MLNRLAVRLLGRRCMALDPRGEPTCWEKVAPDQPGQICDPCWAQIVKEGTVAQRAEAASEPATPDWVVDHLSADFHELVRGLVAERERLEGSPRRRLISRNEVGSVTRKCARRGDLTAGEQRELMFCTDVPTLRILAGSVSTITDVRQQLARHPDEGVRKAANDYGLLSRPS